MTIKRCRVYKEKQLFHLCIFNLLKKKTQPKTTHRQPVIQQYNFIDRLLHILFTFIDN